MNKFVYSVFKAIAVSMILVFVLDMILYVYKALALDQRMKNVMASMQDVVAENNYLPESDYYTYVALFRQIADSMNGDDVNSFIGTSNQGAKALFLNWNTNAKDWVDGSAGESRVSRVISKFNADGVTVKRKMTDIADYGDVMIVQAVVCVRQPTWDFVSTGSSINLLSQANHEETVGDAGESVTTGGERGAAAFQNDRTSNSIHASTAIFNYTYYVPCMNYGKN